MGRSLDAETLIRPAKFSHFVLRVRDLDASIAWYGTLLGMEIVHRGEKLVFLTYDDEHHRLALVETPVATEAPPGAPGLDHVAYTLDSLGDLLATSSIAIENATAATLHEMWCAYCKQNKRYKSCVCLPMSDLSARAIARKDHDSSSILVQGKALSWEELSDIHAELAVEAAVLARSYGYSAPTIHLGVSPVHVT